MRIILEIKISAQSNAISAVLYWLLKDSGGDKNLAVMGVPSLWVGRGASPVKKSWFSL